MKKLFTFNLIQQVLGCLQLINCRKFPDFSKFLKLHFFLIAFSYNSIHAQVISTSTSSTVVIAGGEDFVVNAGVTLSNTNSVATAGSGSTSIVLPNFTNNGSMVGSSTGGAIMSAFNSSVKTNFINNGTMSGKGGINFYSPITLTNNASRSISGTDRAIHFHSGSSGTDLVNNGSIQGNFSSIRIYSGATINSLTNNSTGRIGGTNCNNILGIEHGGTITTLINYGTIRNCRSDFAAINGSSATITTLKNYGVINNNNSTRSISGTAVTNLYNSQSNFNFNGNLPTNYFVYIDGSKTGKITFTNPGSSTLNFGIDPASTLPSGTYAAVLSGINASNIISGTSGVFGEKVWTLTNPTGTQWDLIVSAPATTMSINGGENQYTMAGSVVSLAPSVLVTDDNSNPVSGVSVTFAVASGGGSITGGTAISDASGIATLGSWTLGSTAGINTLTASSTGLSGSPLTFTSTGIGDATQLAFLAQPENAAIGSSTGTITVEILDANGNRVINNTSSVTMSIANNAGSGTLAGTVNVNADAGLVTFSGLSINKVGEGYTLSAASTGLTSAISSAFNITKKELTIADPTLTKTKGYDGTAIAEVVVGALNGVSLDDDITVTAFASYNDAYVGTGKTITVIYSLDGSDATNYISPVNFVVTDGVITAKNLTIASQNLTLSKTHDGTNTASITDIVLDGVEPGDDVTVSGLATYADATVGTGKTITVVYTLDGADAANYLAPENTVVTTGEITANLPTITSTPNTTVPYGESYSYSVVATTEGDLETTLTAPTLPSWLTFSSDGQNSATLYGNVPAGVSLSGVAGDENGNIYAIRQNGTEIFKIEPDGTTTSWKSGMKSGFIVALHIANGYIYVPRYGDLTHSITRIPLNDPMADEEIFLTGYGGIASLIDKGNNVYATDINSNLILKIDEPTKAVNIVLSNTNGIITPFGLTFDNEENLYIATWSDRRILKYDGVTVSSVLSLPNNVSSIRKDRNNNFYLSMSGGGVRKYTSDFSSFQVVSLLATDNIWSLSFTSSGALVYAKYNTNEVYRLQTGAILTGTPAKSDIGDHPVVLRAENNAGFTEQSYTITVTDETAPLVSTLVPANNATDVELQPSLSTTFDEKVVLGTTGTFTVNNGSSVLRTYDLSITEDRNAFTLSENQLTLTLDLDITLPVNTMITVGISAGFVKDIADNDFAGIAEDSNTWRFSTINKQMQTITFPEIATKTYGDETFTLGDAETDRGLTVTYTAVDPTVVSITGNQATILKVGSTTITASQAGDDTQFEAENVQRTLTVGQKAVTITVEDKNKVYGEGNPALTFTYTGFVNGDTQVATEPSITTTATASSNVGTYPITLSGGLDANYDITLVNGTLTVGQKAVTITAEDKNKVYGEENPALTFTYTGLVNGDEKVATEPSIATTAMASSNVGTYPITLTGAADANYDITLVNGTLTVGQKAVTITAEDKNKVYGQANPTLTFTYTGLVNGDEKVAIELSIATTATASSGVGTYPITLVGGVDANYDITLVNGTLSVGQKAVTITAEDKNKVYGEENPALTFTYTGLVNGDTQIATEPSIATSATASSNVGTYPITLLGGVDVNYAITLVNGTLTVNQKAVTITAEDKSKVYGEANPVLTFTYTGLVNGDEKVATEPNIATTATASSNVGTYPITLSGAVDANYAITLVNGTLSVGQKALIITADDKQKIYGESNPTLTFTYTGLVNGDTQVATEPSIATTATASSSVGTYPITLTGGVDANYDITLVDGTLTVGQKAVTITAEDKNKVYGESNPALTFTYTGLVNGDEKVATEPSIATTATASSNVGTYPITLVGGLDMNYDIILVDGTLTVNQKAVTISADDKIKVYGQENPALTFTYTGLVNGDTQVATEPSIATSATASSNVGTYPITLVGGLDANYDITLVNGTLRVGQKAVTITAENKNKVYGEANPTLTFTYTGLVNGDEKVATEPSIATTAILSSAVGTYPITLTGGVDANYDITLVNGTLTVGQKAVTITAENKSKVYAEGNPALTFTYTGLVNGDEKVATEPGIATTATASSAVGTYPITLSGGLDANYDITLVDGELEVTQATLTITANEGQSKIFGTADPVLSYFATGFAAGDDEQVLTGNLTRATGEVVGTYPINLGSLAAGGNYQIVYTSADFEIIPAVIEAVMQPAPIETVWGVYPGLPSTVTVMTTDGQFLALPITWDLQTLYVFGNGEYPLTAIINLPSGILNTEALTVEIVVTVLP
ncbi:MBG domain-containing protein, partial [Belliella aquatica]